MNNVIKDNILRGPGYWRVIIRPSKDEYIKDRLTLSEAREAVRQSKVSKRGWDYPHIDNYDLPPFSQHSIGSASEFSGHNEYWEFTTSGQFSNIFSMIEDTWVTPERATAILARTGFGRGGLSDVDKFFEVVSTVYRFTEIYLFASNLAQIDGLNNVQKWEISINIFGVNGRMLYLEDFGRFLHSKYICLFDAGDPITFIEEFERNKLLGSFNEIALENAIKTFQFFNWQDPSRAVLAEDQLKLLEMRY